MQQQILQFLQKRRPRVSLDGMREHSKFDIPQPHKDQDTSIPQMLWHRND